MLCRVLTDSPFLWGHHPSPVTVSAALTRRTLRPGALFLYIGDAGYWEDSRLGANPVPLGTVWAGTAAQLGVGGAPRSGSGRRGRGRSEALRRDRFEKQC